APDFAARARIVRVDPHLRRQIEGDREAGLAGVEQVAEALVRLLRRPESCVLAHGPETAAVHRGLNAARERKRAGIAEVFPVIRRAVIRTVDGGDRESGRSVSVLRLVPQAPTSSELLASTCDARSTSFFEPMYSGVRWCSSVGCKSRM